MFNSVYHVFAFVWAVADWCSLLAPTETVKQIIINIEAGVEVEVTIAA